MNKRIERVESNPGIYPQPYEGEGDLSGSKEPLNDLRKERIEWWRRAPEKIKRYRAGTAIDLHGYTYSYEAGATYSIGSNGESIEVMDTCETPWANATVDKTFEALRDKRDIKVFERGFGMGITASRIIRHLDIHGGEYTVVELNKANARYANDIWKPKQELVLTETATRGTKPKNNVTINIIKGEAYEETKKLAEAGEKFDIIISDTFPLTEDEQGMNDLLDLETLKHCLKPDGVFTFFAYFPGSDGALELVSRQGEMINKHFETRGVTVSQVGVNPNPDYKYLHTDTGYPVRTLPVIVCKNPIL